LAPPPAPCPPPPAPPLRPSPPPPERWGTSDGRQMGSHRLTGREKEENLRTTFCRKPLHGGGAGPKLGFPSGSQQSSPNLFRVSYFHAFPCVFFFELECTTRERNIWPYLRSTQAEEKILMFVENIGHSKKRHQFSSFLSRPTPLRNPPTTSKEMLSGPRP